MHMFETFEGGPMLVLDSVKVLKMSKAFKARCEQAASHKQMSWSAWARLAMQKQLDRQHDHNQE
jgi:hypothetical protein